MIAVLSALVNCSFAVAADIDSSCDAALGKAKFDAKCGLCHTVTKGTDHGPGPNLYGLKGRRAGTVKGFKFSPAMSGTGILWDAAVLEQFIADPQALVPGTVMPLGGIKSEEDRSALRCFILSPQEP